MKKFYIYFLFLIFYITSLSPNIKNFEKDLSLLQNKLSKTDFKKLKTKTLKDFSLLRSGENQIKIYGFNGHSLEQVTTLDYNGYYFTVSWSPNGKFLALVGDQPESQVQVFEFTNNNLTLFQTLDYGSENVCKSACWSPNGKYLALAGGLPEEQIQVYTFNNDSIFSNNSLNILQTIDYGSGKICNSVSWSPDGKYLALGGNDDLNQIQVYSFTDTTLNLIITDTSFFNVTSIYTTTTYTTSYGATLTDTIESYICNTYTTTMLVDLNTTSSSLNLIDSISNDKDSDSIFWCPNGSYLASWSNITSNKIDVYSFSNNNLSKIGLIDYKNSSNKFLPSVYWNPNNIHLVVGGENLMQATQFHILNGCSI